MTLPIDERIGQYQIIEELGTGGMATVYHAYQERLDRHVALKLMHRGFLQDPQFAARFEREAKIVARLDHPNIVPLYDYDEYQKQPYLVMKLVEGVTLKDRLRKGALPLDEILRVIPQIGEALNYAHDRGILHRDIKPSNILIDPDGRPYLTDFGLARITQAGESSISADTMLGTPHYMSPEQAQGKADIDARTDIYALGVILYELVTGVPPFGGETAYAVIHKHIYAAPPHPSEINPEVPDAVSRVLLKALEKDPADRYSTATSLMDAFQHAVRSSGLTRLDEERVSIASQSLKSLSQKTPGGGSYTTVPQPDGSERAPNLPVAERFGAFVAELSDRVNEAANELRQQISDNPTLRDIRGSMEAGYNNQREEAQKRKFGSSDAHVVQAPISEEDAWQAEEDDIRRRVKRRLQERSGFVVHAGIFFIVMVILFVSQAGAQQSALDALGTTADDAFYRPLLDFQWALLLAFWWGGGVLAHGLRVVLNNGFFADRQQDATQRTMRDIYGADWHDTARPQDYRAIRRTVERRANRVIGFASHLVTAATFFLGFMVIWEPVQQALANLFAGDPTMLALSAELPLPELVFLLTLFTLLVHGLVVALSMVGGADSRERAIQREIARSGIRAPRSSQQRHVTIPAQAAHADDSLHTPAAKQKHEVARDPGAVRLTGDGEFTDSFAQEMDEERGQQRR